MSMLLAMIGGLGLSDGIDGQSERLLIRARTLLIIALLLSPGVFTLFAALVAHWLLTTKDYTQWSRTQRWSGQVLGLGLFVPSFLLCTALGAIAAIKLGFVLAG